MARRPHVNDARPEDPDHSITADQRLAMVFLLRYYMTKTGNGYARIATLAGIPAVYVGKKGKQKYDKGKHIQNFYVQFSAQHQHVAKILEFLKQQYSLGDDLYGSAPPLVQDLVAQMLGAQSARLGFADQIFSQVVEDGDKWKARIANVYGGAWFIVRFAAHVGKGLESPQKDENGNDDPWMVYGLMNVQRKSEKIENDLPAFTILYHPWAERLSEPPHPIYGNIIALRGPYMQFIGYEEGTKYPLIVETEQNVGEGQRPETIKGFVLRKLERGSLAAGLVMFVRSKRPWNELIAHRDFGNPRLLVQSQLIKLLQAEVSDIKELIEDVRNVVYHNGYCMLRL